MSVSPPRDRRAERRAATRAEILDAAWELVRAQGLASLAMRELGARVGMRAQSLYAYFPSKQAIYDAMFADANRELLHRLTATDPAVSEPVDRLGRHAQVFLEFCGEDPVRYQLLFQRTIPGFVPTEQAYAPAVAVMESARAALRGCGITSDRAFDAWTAVTAGLAGQQISNDPGGNRWIRLADEVIDMYLTHYRPPTAGMSRRPGNTKTPVRQPISAGSAATAATVPAGAVRRAPQPSSHRSRTGRPVAGDDRAVPEQPRKKRKQCTRIESARTSPSSMINWKYPGSGSCP
jgi:AcrR family transcriptional regulator